MRHGAWQAPSTSPASRSGRLFGLRALTAVLMTFGMVLSGADATAATGPAHLLRDINPTPSSNRGSFPENYQRLGKIALFRASTPQTGKELWRTDGTEAGTFLVKDINPGGAEAFTYPGFEEPDDPFAELGSALIFLADDGVHGFELWTTDGTEAGTFLLKDIFPGSTGAFGYDYSGMRLVGQEAGGSFFFQADDGTHGYELWKTDGTPAGTIDEGAAAKLGQIYPA
jgi:ELWxxDGT repeat protein